jgi:hypothetical protein
MKELASFEFHGIDALLPRESIVRMGNDTVSIRLFRRMRTEPLPGMKQPLLNHAIMGLETVLEILFEGKPAARHRWKLCRLRGKSAKVVQRGETDEHGISGDIAVGLSSPPPQFLLLVYAPKRPVKATPVASS